MQLCGSFSFSTYFALFNIVCLKIKFCLNYYDQENPQKYSPWHLGQEVTTNLVLFSIPKLTTLLQAVF